VVNQSMSALICLSPSLNAVDTQFSADRPMSLPIHFEMSSDDVSGRALQFRAEFQHLGNFTYVSDPVFFPFPGENRLQNFATAETHLVLEVDNCSCVFVHTVTAFRASTLLFGRESGCKNFAPNQLGNNQINDR